MNPRYARGPALAATLAALALGLAACGGDDEDGGDEAGAPPATQAETAAPPTETEQASGDAVKVEMYEFRFEPESVEAARGDSIEVLNEGQTPHNLTIEDGSGDEPGEELAATDTLDPGGTATLELDVPAGEYALVCTVPGHREAGMVGSITLE